MSHFAKTVVVAILLLAVLVVAFGGLDLTVSPSGGTTGTPFVQPPTPPPTGGLFVGTQQVEAAATVNLGTFDISRLQKLRTAATFDNLRVYKGVLSEKTQRTTFTLTGAELESLKGGSLIGNVTATNRYGDIYVKLNDAFVYADAPRGGTSFEKPLNVTLFREQNELVIGTGSSTWRVWAPTTYIVNISLAIGAEGDNAKEITTTIPSDRFPLSKGRIVFKAQSLSGAGNLSILINGVEVYNAKPLPPTHATLVDFDGRLLRTTNTILFRATGDSLYRVTGAEFLYFYRQQPEASATHTFTLTRSEHNRLPGELTFTINRIFGSPSGLVVDLQKPDGTKRRAVVQGIIQENRTVTIELTRDNVGEGTNRALFSIIGDGGFELRNFAVRT